MQGKSNNLLAGVIHHFEDEETSAQTYNFLFYQHFWMICKKETLPEGVVRLQLLLKAVQSLLLNQNVEMLWHLTNVLIMKQVVINTFKF